MNTPSVPFTKEDPWRIFRIMAELDELFEVLSLVQTTRIPRFPIILFGAQFWDGLLKWSKGTLQGNNMISPGDLDLVHVTDSIEEVISIITEYMRKVGPPEQIPKT